MIYEKQYETIQEYECLNACITNYVHYQKIELTGCEIFLSSIPVSIKKNREQLYLETNAPVISASFVKKYQIPFHMMQLQGKAQAMDFIKESVDKEKCLVIETKPELLHYSPAFAQTRDLPHNINVIGRDGEEQLYISDGYIPSVQPAVFQGFVPCDDIFRAWEANSYKNYILEDLAGLDRTQIIRNAEHNFYQSISDYLKSKGEKGKLEVYGEEAVQVFFQEFSRDIKQEEDKVEFVKNVNYVLKVRGFLNSKRYYLQMMKELKVSEQLATEYQEVINRWNNLCFYMLKVAVTNREKQFSSIEKSAAEILEAEHDLYKSIL